MVGAAGGTWGYLLQQIQAAADVEGEVDWDIPVDFIIVRAHQHAAGARIVLPAPVSKGDTAGELMGHHPLNGAFSGSACVATVNTSPGRIQ